jgi:MoxR-like ATPase
MTEARPYSGRPSPRQPQEPLPLPLLDMEKAADPKGYIPDEGLVDAVNVALLLQQPLLLTGEPGTGKTQLAYSIAWELGLAEPLVFETKSTSLSRDLFYTFDNVRRFQASHKADEDIDPRLFIQFNALGLAILQTLDPSEAARYLPPGAELHQRVRRSVVLIDEIDKAPRDFPNDILNEIEKLYFRIPELRTGPILAGSALRPIVVITSNSEKSLPDAFLRRCIFYHIPFPDETRLEEIVLSRVSGLSSGTGTVLTGVLDFFERLRQPQAGLRKKPGTAELLNWVAALMGVGIEPAVALKSQAEKAVRTLSALAKHPEDQVRVIGLFKTWIHE